MISDTAWITLGGMVPATIIAAATLWTAIRSGKKTELIQKQTNGTLSALREDLKAANDQLALNATNDQLAKQAAAQQLAEMHKAVKALSKTSR